MHSTKQSDWHAIILLQDQLHAKDQNLSFPSPPPPPKQQSWGQTSLANFTQTIKRHMGVYSESTKPSCMCSSWHISLCNNVQMQIASHSSSNTFTVLRLALQQKFSNFYARPKKMQSTVKLQHADAYQFLNSSWPGHIYCNGYFNTSPIHTYLSSGKLNPSTFLHIFKAASHKSGPSSTATSNTTLMAIIGALASSTSSRSFCVQFSASRW